ncbi:Sua5 YciO YrdC YwlC family protein [Helicobacter anatolicus]|uniref:Sua5 YciO YrdC YwlC family protein n=1 Tax=Helicobacter anatolicus TaxID=2905874 RepID=UPI001E4EE517|nr:Sua5 YciO YrdC YwlC family protein [Helicobacter anatolicus]MCE3038096.1 Sua5 YciO YrdC YwlC family protein [Helicobacter anatolicus]
MASFRVLRECVRIPSYAKNTVRRAKNTTFIYGNNQAFRVIKDKMHIKFVQKFYKIFSSSANATGEHFCMDWALENSDVWICDSRKFEEKKASRIYKIFRKKMKKIR